MEYSDLTLTVAVRVHPDPAPIVPTVVPSYATANPLAPGYNPYNYNYNPYNYKYNPTATSGPAVPILTYSNENNPDGSYSYSYSTADGKQMQESGYLKDAYIDNNGEPQGTQVVQGSYAYVSPEGTPIQVSYVADENGFRPSGVHIPADGKAFPPIPVLDRRNGTNFDPLYNRYNPYYNNRLGAYQRPYDTRYNYDPRYRYDSRYQYDPRRPYDARYNAYYNKYNPVPQVYPSNVDLASKQE
ncbi:hypothetical protein ACJJTC_015736 [Scirpophaga incertulas]